jgi:hypothetical protein
MMSLKEAIVPSGRALSATKSVSMIQLKLKQVSNVLSCPKLAGLGLWTKLLLQLPSAYHVKK